MKLKAVNGKDIYDDKYFEKHFYTYNYNSEIRELLIKYKFRDNGYLFRTLSYLIGDLEILKENNYDIILPVPVSKKRYKERGYNQSYLIAKEISQKINCKVENRVLIKVKNNSPQSTLNQEERNKNVQGMYGVVSIEKIKNKKILLVDDIFTTGSTVNECSKVLCESGSRSIDVYTVGKD